MAGPFDNDLLTGLIGGRPQIRALFSAEAELVAAIEFEIALARAEADSGLIPPEATEAISESLQTFEVDPSSLESDVARDGVMVPGLIAQLRDHVGDPHAAHLHYGATSQDVIDTGLVLRLRDAMQILVSDLEDITAALARLNMDYGSNTLAGVTRMQDALAITVSDRIEAWRAPLVRHLERIAEIRPRLLQVQFGGAVGTLDKLGKGGDAVRARLASVLDLGDPGGSWHSGRDALAEYAHWLSLVTGSLGKLGTDVALMAQTPVGAITFEGGGTSSAMPHKRNPVDAEVLVSLARYNAVQLSGMHQTLVHEQERSGSAWTLEWMILPQMVTATSAALERARHLLSCVTGMGKASS